MVAKKRIKDEWIKSTFLCSKSHSLTIWEIEKTHFALEFYPAFILSSHIIENNAILARFLHWRDLGKCMSTALCPRVEGGNKIVVI